MATHDIDYCKSDDDFKSLVTERKAVILDFYADWCPPCKKLGEVLHDKIKSSNGWNVVKVDVDNEGNGQVAADHQVQGIPAVFLYLDGVKSDSFVGYNAAKLDEFIAKAAKHISG